MTRNDELKADYKQNWHRLRTMGVFQIKNHVNGKVYLAASTNLEGTMERDRRWLELGGHMNKTLQADWKRCGPAAFTIDVLDTVEPSDVPRDYREELALMLDLWKESLQPWGEGGYLPMPRG